jgi:hypothetical protein
MLLNTNTPGAFDIHPRVHLTGLVRDDIFDASGEITQLIQAPNGVDQLRYELHGLIIFRLRPLLILLLNCRDTQLLKLRDFGVDLTKIHGALSYD